jgi:biopolymer transport protein ExbB
MLFFIVKGGIMMIPIILASIAGAGIIIDRFIVIRRVYRLDMQKFSREILDLVDKGRYREALEICSQKKDYPLAAMYAAAVDNRLLSRAELEKLLERMGNHAVKTLEKRLGGLVSVVGISPLMGFLGTITGLIRAFMAWEKAATT